MITTWAGGAAALVLLLAVGCGDDGSSAGSGGGGGGAPNGPSVGSGGACTAAEEFAAPGQDILFDTTSYFGGTHAIEGTIELPSGTASCLYGQFQITKTNPYDGTTGINPTTSAEDPLRFRVEGLPDGEYWIFLRLDTDGDFDMDLEGHHGGTVESPIQVQESSVAIVVNGGDVTGVEFGIGPLP